MIESVLLMVESVLLMVERVLLMVERVLLMIRRVLLMINTAPLMTNTILPIPHPPIPHPPPLSMTQALSLPHARSPFPTTSTPRYSNPRTTTPPRSTSSSPSPKRSASSRAPSCFVAISLSFTAGSLPSSPSPYPFDPPLSQIFPLQIVVQSFPHTVRYWLPKLQDALFSDLLLLALAFIALFAAFFLTQRRQPPFSLVLSLLCWLLAAACCLEFFLSSRRHPFIPIVKSILQMAAIAVFAAGVPQSLNEATQVGTIATRAWLPSLTLLVTPGLLSVFYVVDQLVASQLKNQCCAYLLPAAYYLLLYGLRKRLADLNELSLLEVSRVSGLVFPVSYRVIVIPSPRNHLVIITSIPTHTILPTKTNT